MKAFKKWWKKKYKSDFDEYKPIGEVAWRAALEWVQENCVLTAIGDFDIKEELEE